MSSLLIKLINMSISASWLVLAVACIRFLFKKAPRKLFCALWALVAIRLVVPFAPESGVSLVPSGETIPEEILVSDAPTVHSGIAALNSAVNPILENFAGQKGSDVPPINECQSIAGAVSEPIARTPMRTAADIAVTVWLIGVSLMAAYALISYIRVRRSVKLSVVYDKKRNIWQSENIDTPFLLGLFRPCIYVPYGLSDDIVFHVAAHELSHIKRRDHIIKPAAYLLLSVYWFNPLMWLAYALLSKDIELACDERVISELGEEYKRSYSEALVKCSLPRSSIAACPIAFCEAGIKERVKNVLNYKKPTLYIIIAAVIICAVLAVCFLTNPRKNPEPVPAQEASERCGVYCGGSFIGQNAALSYMPDSGAHLRRIIINGGALTIVFDNNVFQSARSETSELTYEQLLDTVNASNVVAFSDGGVGDFFERIKFSGSASLTRYFDDEDGSRTRYAAVFLPNGSAWIAEGDFMRLYELVPFYYGCGAYEFESCVYMSPFSSTFIPEHEGTGEYYAISSDSFRIIDEKTGAANVVVYGISWDWRPITNEEWAENIIFSEDAKLYDESDPLSPRPVISKMGNGYSLICNGGDILLVSGDYNSANHQTGFFSVFSLKATPELELPRMSLSDVLRLSASGRDGLTFDMLNCFAHTDIGSGLYIYSFPINERWSLIMACGGAVLDYNFDFSHANLWLRFEPSGSECDLFDENIADFIGERESRAAGLPVVFSGASVCTMLSSDSEHIGSITYDPNHDIKRCEPFTVYFNGEICPGGQYTIRDYLLSVPSEPISFRTPSGLCSQAWILKGLAPHRSYLVTFSCGDSAEYAFIIMN